ncbi:helix-turn-helix domain-containing protein [Inquilinus sp. CAU 1745]|uniref:helix-turn-helix domain-containing protein n=1 Tax=Inquilinus sp. CAU 1745 TaxID=3140369 RepID=UPI00325B46CB
MSRVHFALNDPQGPTVRFQFMETAEAESVPAAGETTHTRSLSPAAASFVREHPEQAELALIVALEAAAATATVHDNPAVRHGLPPALEPFIVETADTDAIVNVSEAAALLNVSRTTVYEWVRIGKLIAWGHTRRGLAVPAEQILGPGRVVDGVSGVLEIIEEPELAWTFLSEPWPFEDELARPIDRLKYGAIDEVLDAAPAFGMTFT